MDDVAILEIQLLLSQLRPGQLEKAKAFIAQLVEEDVESIDGVATELGLPLQCPACPPALLSAGGPAQSSPAPAAFCADAGPPLVPPQCSVVAAAAAAACQPADTVCPEGDDSDSSSDDCTAAEKIALMSHLMQDARVHLGISPTPGGGGGVIACMDIPGGVDPFPVCDWPPTR
eukprot:NODE_21385_length_756_cov_1.465819.p1 GENE.NODE_21385_length_756_cov_1.465819~~NODE_21385_length_756_cov_1.465819.p1  ORF type:complete len:174 (+),score=40.53 NODE_21385_length_756_cov_1.465819:161-682(+)